MQIFGCQYLHLFYPSNIRLPLNSNYIFNFKSNRFNILIKKHLKSLIINDFNNSIVTIDELPKFNLSNRTISLSSKSKVLTMDDDVDTASFILDDSILYHKEIYKKDYTEIIINFECHHSQDNHLLGLEALEHFIKVYRNKTQDVLTLQLDKVLYVPKILKAYFYKYTDADLKVDTDSRLTVNRMLGMSLVSITMPFWNTQGKKLATDPKVNEQTLKQSLETLDNDSHLLDFVLKAREELEIHSNYKYSFIESWTLIEVAIVNFLRAKKLERGISKTKIDNFEKEIGISYLLNIELPLVIAEPLTEELKELIRKIDGIRKVRNDLIHKNREILLEDAKNAFATAIQFLNFMGENNVKF